jgi:RNA-splicing ligase RtcB
MNGFKEALNKYLETMSEGHIKGYLHGEMMKGYLMDMCFAQLYAQFNHMTVQKTIKELLIKYGIKEVRTIMSTHNFIDLHDHTLRKSAIRSYKGEEMLVPFNMRDGVAICEGLSNPEWLNACAHGAGRKMSRSKAKENVSLEEFKESMRDVYSTTVCRGTIDESPMAYKDTNEIKELILETCEIRFMMIPKINIKAADGGD